VLKPAEETPLDAFVLADAAIAAGLPPGVLNVLPADRTTSEHLVSHSGVDKVSFTGSTSAGQRIAAICGGDVRRVTLELGGKSAAILLDDAELDDAVPKIVSFGLAWNNGQACSALTRILAPRSRYDEVVEATCDYVRKLVVGEPRKDDTDIGPVISARQRERVEAYIAWGRSEGAQVEVGGRRPAHATRGWYIEPTVFSDVRNDMRIAREEIFGPVAVVIPYDGDDEAVALANDSPYGLAGAVFTRDDARGLSVATKVRSGIYGINMLAVDLACPFGGQKQSGVGREMGPEGFTSFLETKSIFGAPRS
jgi:betaine-aldehyde dehydrogenase